VLVAVVDDGATAGSRKDAGAWWTLGNLKPTSQGFLVCCVVSKPMGASVAQLNARVVLYRLYYYLVTCVDRGSGRRTYQPGAS